MRHAAYVFDAYGTLFDVHAAVRRHAGEIGPEGQRFSELWRAKQLEYSWVFTLMGEYTDFWTMTERALDFAFARIPSVDRRLRQDLLDAYWQLDCYEEVPAVLKALKAGGARLAVLSNGSPAMLESAIRSSALDTVLDEVFSVETVRRFKTDQSVYEMVTNAWRIYPQNVSFQSSNRWDVAGAQHFGFRTVWLNRTDQPDEYEEFPPDLILPSLDGLLT
ncbi:haloacid dehalogenase type II [Nitratireductor aquimarinus]|uniref:(S)-2-haloacid dehalogenase n=2 Tax=Alphaproteobacteria TaxID=28211 RepID=A0ABU4AN16_9HYPH|nr:MULTISPECIES: haloacid dehalogenase type II [Nitratireductor]MBY5998659.1 haloacid dehalogenase type II [Tritonibacter mobilis]MBY6020688.1 haloacid dehalogenase type II [Nitratireductor sp. DP7N14-4]MBN7755902.1 haloacid dehalogenase type II [Nitratireductor aquimarinus]MBN7762563.1 haloacid dehalogenase type II [Nitratireductor aquibiodomus]MBN7777638.1 haloacid dehalogenase type II [Nitratireductor pacificus]